LPPSRHHRLAALNARQRAKTAGPGSTLTRPRRDRLTVLTASRRVSHRQVVYARKPRSGPLSLGVNGA
jgi:hypothetical protein